MNSNDYSNHPRFKRRYQESIGTKSADNHEDFNKKRCQDCLPNIVTSLFFYGVYQYIKNF